MYLKLGSTIQNCHGRKRSWDSSAIAEQRMSNAGTHLMG